MSLDSSEHKQGVGSDSRETLWRLKAGLGEEGLGEGVPEEEPLGGGRRAEVTTGFLGVPGAPFGILDASRENLLRPGTDPAHTRAGHCPLPCPSRSGSPPPGSHPLCSELCMSFPCGAPHPRPVGQSPSAFPLPEVSFCGLDVSQYLISQFISPQSVSINGSPLPPLSCKYQSHRGKKTELLQGRSRIA